MVKGIHNNLKEIIKLTYERDELQNKLNDALEIIEAIKKGNIDTVIVANATSKTFISETTDQIYQRFIENMTEGVVTLHTNGTILYCNSSFARIVDLPLEKVVGKDFRNYIPLKYKEIFEGFFKQYSSDKTNIELSISNKRNGCAHFIVSINKLRLRDFDALNLVWTDVTSQKRNEEKLISVNKAFEGAIEEQLLSEKKVVILNYELKKNIAVLKDANIELSTFAHIASHDLQEPLRKIMTYSSFLISNYYEKIDKKGQHYLYVMQRASERMRNLIFDILEYTKLSQKDFVAKSTNLQSVFEEILSNLEIVIKETNAVITVEGELPVIEANSSQMLQLFQNIISNSLKFKRPDIIPEINISFKIVDGKNLGKIEGNRLNGKFYIFYIKDNGIGIDKAYLDKIFIAFKKLNSNSHYHGSGIGLAICKRIVERHHGFITANSERKDGSLFTITLPVKYLSRKRIKKIGDTTKPEDKASLP